MSEDRIRDLERQVSELSRNTAGQWLRLGSGGGSDGADGSSTIQMMVVTTAISAASGDITSITPSTDGKAQQYQTDPDTFVRTPTEDDPVDILNYDTCQSYAVRTLIYVVPFGDGTKYEVISAACCQMDSGE